MSEHADIPIYRKPASAVLMGLAALFMTAKSALAQSAAPPTAPPSVELAPEAAPATATPAVKPVEQDPKDVVAEPVAVTRAQTASEDVQIQDDQKEAPPSSDSTSPAPKTPAKDPTAQRDQDFRKQMADLDRTKRDQQRMQRDLARAQQQVQQLSKRLAGASERLAKLQMEAAGIPAGEPMPGAGAGLWMRSASGAAMGMAPLPAPKAENLLPPTATAPEQNRAAEDRAKAVEKRRQAADDRRMDRIERQMGELARALDQLRRDLHKSSDTAPESGARR